MDSNQNRLVTLEEYIIQSQNRLAALLLMVIIELWKLNQALFTSEHLFYTGSKQNVIKVKSFLKKYEEAPV